MQEVLSLVINCNDRPFGLEKPSQIRTTSSTLYMPNGPNLLLVTPIIYIF